MDTKSRKRIKIAKRCTIDLTTSAAAEVERMQGIFELSVADVFRYSLLLMSMYADAISEGRELATINPEKPSDFQRIKLPMFNNIDRSNDFKKAIEEVKQPEGEAV